MSGEMAAALALDALRRAEKEAAEEARRAAQEAAEAVEELRRTAELVPPPAPCTAIQLVPASDRIRARDRTVPQPQIHPHSLEVVENFFSKKTERPETPVDPEDSHFADAMREVAELTLPYSNKVAWMLVLKMLKDRFGPVIGTNLRPRCWILRVRMMAQRKNAQRHAARTH